MLRESAQLALAKLLNLIFTIMLRTLFSTKPIFENSLLLIRIIAGLLIFMHGLGTFNEGHMKGNIAWLSDLHFPAPVFMAYLGKGAELIGGVLLMLGLFTRVAAIVLVINMSVICFVLGSGNIFTDDETPFLLLTLSVYLFIAGPGKISLDYFIFDRKSA
jgi:putative oxidoreductase